MIPVHNNLVFKPENFNTSSEPGVTIILRNQEFLTSKASEILLFEDEDLRWTEMEFSHKHFLGYLDNRPCFVSCLSDSSQIDKEMILSPLRALLGRIPDTLFAIFSRSLQIDNWFVSNQFCGSCGKGIKPHDKERAMVCECKGSLIYPTISPCIIVLVTNGEDLLLAHNKNFP